MLAVVLFSVLPSTLGADLLADNGSTAVVPAQARRAGAGAPHASVALAGAAHGARDPKVADTVATTIEFIPPFANVDAVVVRVPV